MKQKFLSAFAIVMIAALSACGPAPTPTMSASDMASTAVALAWTGVAMTQASMPTSTPVPPTDTPMPSPTVAALPTFSVPTIVDTPIGGGAPAAVGTGTLDPCNDIPPAKPQGATVKVRFVNKTDGTVNLGFGMNKPNTEGECGTYTIFVGAHQAPIETVLQGCYWGYGWVTGGKKPSTPATGGTLLCLTDAQATWSVTITNDLISFSP